MASTFKISADSDDFPEFDAAIEREKHMNFIKNHHEKNGKHKVTQATVKNIMLIGRSRTGKSTIKTLLVDPTKIPEDMELKSGTKNPLFESFHIADKQVVLNIIDTPGLFERGIDPDEIRNNPAILKTIKVCVNREITKFNFVCFCVSITNGINQQDIESLEILAKFLGPELSRNSCLIITHCEMKNDEQRKSIRAQLLEDSHFKNIASFFEHDIFFSGSINYDDYINGNSSIIAQYRTCIKYRQQLIKFFSETDIKEFQINKEVIEKILDSNNEGHTLKEEITMVKQQADIINELSQAHREGETNMKPIIEKLIASNNELNAHLVTSEMLEEKVPDCHTS